VDCVAHTLQGSLSDRFGKKVFIVPCAVIGLVGSIVSATSHHTYQVIIGNIFTGIANAGCIMGVPAGQEVTPNKFRPWTMGFSQALASAVVIAGTLGAGADVKYHNFRWAYGTNAIVYGCTAILVAAFYWPPPPGLRRQGNRLRELVMHVDYIGILLFTGSIAALVIGLTWGGSTYPWNSGMVLQPRVILKLTKW